MYAIVIYKDLDRYYKVSFTPPCTDWGLLKPLHCHNVIVVILSSSLFFNSYNICRLSKVLPNSNAILLNRVKDKQILKQ